MWAPAFHGLPHLLSLASVSCMIAVMLQGSWQHVEGEFKSVMAIVTPCRSDQSTLGLAPYGHLADGRIQLVMVHKCSVLQYLRFLAAIPQAGKPQLFQAFLDSCGRVIVTCVCSRQLVTHLKSMMQLSWYIRWLHHPECIDTACRTTVKSCSAASCFSIC